MPLGRNARQARQRPQRKSNGQYQPRIDVFGTLRLPDAGGSKPYEARVRLIEYAPQKFAGFTADAPQDPILFQTTEADFAIKGRVMTATLQDPHEGAEVKFQKAGCGCETPHQLRGARTPLLAYVPIAEEELEQETPDTVHELHREIMP